MPFSVLESLIRMGHKYAIQDVLKDAMARLKKYYTDNLDVWLDEDGRAKYVETNRSDAMNVIQLARLTNTPTLLPVAHLICSTLHSHTLLSYLPNEDSARILEGRSLLMETCALRIFGLLRAPPATDCDVARF